MSNSLTIQENYRITATTRDATKAQRLYDLFPHYKNKIEFVSVPDFTVPDAFDSILEANQFDYILHTASPIPFETDYLQKDIIAPCPAGVTSLFGAAHRHSGSRLKRIILTGSAVAVLNPFLSPDSDRKHPFTEKDWNPVTTEMAVRSGNSNLAYLATKTLAERVAWDFVQAEKPSWDLTVLQPVIVLGPVLTPLTQANNIEQGDRKHVYAFMNGERKTTDVPFFSYTHVDVRDVALAHIIALDHPAAGGERILLCSPDVMTPQTVVNSINKHFPQLGHRVASGNPDQIYPSGVNDIGIDGSKATKVLGHKFEYTPLETSVQDVVAQILEAEARWK